MAVRGPKPMPKGFQVLQGGRSLAATNDVPEPSRPTELPAAPAFLKGLAAEEWERVIGDLYSTGVYANIDQNMLAAYCIAYARWRTIEADLDVMAAQDAAAHGVLIKTTNGNVIQNPMLGAATTALKNMERLAAEFGLTPSSRTRLSGKGPGQTDPIGKKYGFE